MAMAQTSVFDANCASTSCPYFDGNIGIFSNENIDLLKCSMTFHKVAAGSYLFWEGDPTGKLYFIQQGHAKTFKSTNDGKEFTLALFQNGDLFGEPRIRETSRYKYNAKVSEESIIGVLEQQDIDRLLTQPGDLAIQFMKWMGIMHSMTQTKLRDLLLYGKPGALASTLIRMSNSYGKPVDGGGILISHKLSNTELANIIGTARESVNRMLNKWKSKDIIDLENGYIIIHNLTYLQNICHCQDCPREICRM